MSNSSNTHNRSLLSRPGARRLARSTAWQQVHRLVVSVDTLLPHGVNHAKNRGHPHRGAPAAARRHPATAAPAPLGGGSLLSVSSGAYRCTAAFAARHNTTGVLIAGPGCAAPSGTPLYSNGVLVGPVSGSTANGGVTFVTVTNTAAWQLVPWIPLGGTRYTIRGSAETPVGGSVCLLDRAMGVQCGTVTAKNQTVNHPGGTLYGLTRTNICMSPGSAIAFITGDQAQGVPLGGTGNCGTGGSSFFHPVNRILSAYGLTLVTG